MNNEVLLVSLWFWQPSEGWSQGLPPCGNPLSFPRVEVGVSLGQTVRQIDAYKGQCLSLLCPAFLC